MKDSEINEKFEKQDAAIKQYIDLKLRAYSAKTNNALKPFIWMVNNPGKTIIALIILFMLSAWGFHRIDFNKTFVKKTGIELK